VEFFEKKTGLEGIVLEVTSGGNQPQIRAFHRKIKKVQDMTFFLNKRKKVCYI
jgi:hypothetical protein